jgi:exodeoxyribonuclease III
MKFISWNVNGIRACVNKGFLEYLQTENPDIIGLQEVKAKADQNPIVSELSDMGYQIYWNGAERPGYSGTAIFTKKTPLSVEVWLGGKIEDDNEGRVLTLEFPDFYFTTVYTPNAKPDLARLEYRTRWDAAFLAHMNEREKKKPNIFCGDLNVAHREIDLKNPSWNRGNAGFTDEERSGFQGMVDAGFIDSFRHFYPETPEAYTWWSNFFQSRARNIWWRIDYHMVSPRLREALSQAFIRPEVLGSDHCPVGIELR